MVVGVGVCGYGTQYEEARFDFDNTVSPKCKHSWSKPISSEFALAFVVVSTIRYVSIMVMLIVSLPLSLSLCLCAVHTIDDCIRFVFTEALYPCFTNRNEYINKNAQVHRVTRVTMLRPEMHEQEPWHKRVRTKAIVCIVRICMRALYK